MAYSIRISIHYLNAKWQLGEVAAASFNNTIDEVYSNPRFQNDMQELITKNGIDEQTTIGNWLRIWDASQVFAILVPYHVK